MTWAGWMRLLARREAIRRISCTDQRISGGHDLGGEPPFYRICPVGMLTDGSEHGKGQHDKRDVAVPAMPGTRFVVVETEFVLGGLEAIFDRPSVSLDPDQRLDRRAGGTPSGEEGQFFVREMTRDQEATRPETG